MFYMVARNTYCAARSSLTEEQAQELALKWGPASVVKPEGCHEYVTALEFWPGVFGELGAGKNWCPRCQKLFEGVWEYSNGYAFIRCECGNITRKIVGAILDKMAPIRRDEHDPTDPFSI